MKLNRKYGCLLALIVVSATLCAQGNFYRMEAGLQGGIGYYVGDATRHIFNNVQPVAGAQLRYKFDQRWAMQLKGQWTQIKFPVYEEQMVNNELFIAKLKQKEPMLNFDLVGEFNFFRFGEKQYDDRVKQATPYIFIGIGGSLYQNYSAFTPYIPLGFGVKWKFAPRWTLIGTWQHQIYFKDNLENRAEYDNTYELNGSNLLNNDLTSTLTLGIVFEFYRKVHRCIGCGL